EISLNAIGPRVVGSRVQWLEDALALVQQRSVRTLSKFDDELTLNLKQFQQQQGLKADGIAGRDTLSRLDMLLNTTGPQLTQAVQ
ncbi:MAG: peptidoglycan-binding domain-containing protein, partial [Shewanella sp.]